MRIIFATNSENKLKEVKSLKPENLDLEIVGLKEVGINIDPTEYGKTLAVNALIKVETIQQCTKSNDIIIGEDSGFYIDTLFGFPGVLSKRFMDGTDFDRNQHFIDIFHNQPTTPRNASLVCFYAIAFPNFSYMITKGELKGTIATEQRGENGFAYDKILIPEGYNKTLAEMTLEEKNLISFRSMAVKKVWEILEGYFN